MSAIDAVGKFGINSLTGYLGMLKIGNPGPGDTVVVSGAGGGVGSIAVQVARTIGARVVGIAEGKEKCAWLQDECGVDGVIEYNSDDVDVAIGRKCPAVIDFFFDNVGGRLLEMMIDHMAKFRRIVLC